MDSTPPDPRSRLDAWRPVALAVILIALVLSTFRTMRGPGAERSSQSVQLVMSVSLQARVLYLLAEGPALLGPQRSLAVQKRGLLRDARKLVDVAQNPTTVRRMAVVQYLYGDPGWQASLLKLRAMPAAGPPLAVERELAMWRLALQGKPTAGQMAQIRRQVIAMRLGWYEHVALEAAYHNAGMPGSEGAQRRAAMRSPLLLFLAEFIVIGAIMAGFVICLAVILWVSVRSLRTVPLPRALRPAPAPVLARSKGDVLYTAFIVFLATFAAIKLLAGSLLRPALDRADAGATGTMLVSVGITIAEIGVPILVLVLLGRRVGLTAADVGWRTNGLFADALWGIGGYLAGLPLVLIVTLVASFVFNVLLRSLHVNIETPINPAITEFIAAPSNVVKLLVFVEAAVLAPLAEETMFRGVLFGALSARSRRVVALVLASAVFAVLHPQLPLGFFAIFVLGAVFNALYLLRGSLVPNMVAHAINNTAIVIFLTLALGS